MRKALVSIITATLLALPVLAQKAESTPEKPADKPKETIIAATETKGPADPADLARKAIAAHGGDAFRSMRTLIVRGSADLSGSPSQVIPATFVTIFSGDKYRFEISNPFQPFKQTYDGEQTVSSLPGFTLPPLNRLGLPLLQRLDDKDFKVSALPDGAKKKGFRITSPEGYFTDFFIDEKTFEIKGYQASYLVGERSITTAVEIDKFREVSGIKIPERYSQRFELGFATFYSDFKAKEILVNNDVADDVFKN